MSKMIYETIDGFVYRVIKMTKDIPHHFRFVHENGEVLSVDNGNTRIPLIFITLHEAEVFAFLHNIKPSKIHECGEGIIYENGCFIVKRK